MREYMAPADAEARTSRRKKNSGAPACYLHALHFSHDAFISQEAKRARRQPLFQESDGHLFKYADAMGHE